MKLTRLSSTTQRTTRESSERVRPVDNEQVRRVEVMDGIEGDRQRTLQQEIAEAPLVIFTVRNGCGKGRATSRRNCSNSISARIA